MSGDGSGLQGGALSVNWELDLWAPRAVRARRGAADAAAADVRLRVRATVDCGRRRQELVPRDRSRAAGRRGARDHWQQRDAGPAGRGSRCASASATTKTSSSRARRSGPIATACVRSSSRASRRFARSKSCSAAIRRRDRAQSAAAGPTRRRCRAVCRPSCSNGGPTSWPPSAASPRRSTASAKPRPPVCRRSRSPPASIRSRAICSCCRIATTRSGVSAPICCSRSFRGGALKTQVEIRTAEQKQAVAAYAVVGQRAFSEVENALAAEIVAREREQILAQTLADSRRALEIVQTQFKVGSTDLRFVTQRQLALNATQSAVVRVQTEQRVQRVNLHLALGGTFESKPEPRATEPNRNGQKRSDPASYARCPPDALALLLLILTPVPQTSRRNRKRARLACRRASRGRSTSTPAGARSDLPIPCLRILKRAWPRTSATNGSRAT